MRIYLLGFMGSGKSHTGRRLAELLDYPFLDLDALIEEQAKMTIPAVFALEGEEGFRRRERQALRDTLQYEHLVVACGGGAPCFFDNMAWMNQHGLTIYLEAAVELLVERLLPGRANRPLIARLSETELPQFIEEKLSTRDPVYRQARIVFSQRSPFENIADALKKEIERLDRG